MGTRGRKREAVFVGETKNPERGPREAAQDWNGRKA